MHILRVVCPYFCPAESQCFSGVCPLLQTKLLGQVFIALSWYVDECQRFFEEQPFDAILANKTGQGCVLGAPLESGKKSCVRGLVSAGLH